MRRDIDIMDAALRGRFRDRLPEGLLAMRGGRGWQGGWGPFHFDFGDEPEAAAAGAAAAAGGGCSNAASFGLCC